MLALLPAAALIAVQAPPAAQAPAAPPRFDPLRFFAGATEGQGRLKIVFKRGRAVHVRGTGRVGADGALVLDQRVEQEGRAPQDRRWVIRPLGPARWGGTLTDADGPVAIDAEGDRLRIRYKMKDGIGIEQRLTLSPDGRSARNRLSARKLGIVVGRLDETIRRLD